MHVAGQWSNGHLGGGGLGGGGLGGGGLGGGGLGGGGRGGGGLGGGLHDTDQEVLRIFDSQNQPAVTCAAGAPQQQRLHLAANASWVGLKHINLACRSALDLECLRLARCEAANAAWHGHACQEADQLSRSGTSCCSAAVCELFAIKVARANWGRLPVFPK